MMSGPIKRAAAAIKLMKAISWLETTAIEAEARWGEGVAVAVVDAVAAGTAIGEVGLYLTPLMPAAT